MYEIIGLFKKDVPRQKKVYQEYNNHSKIKNLSYANFKTLNIAFIEIKDYIASLDEYYYLSENQIDNMFDYLKENICINRFTQMKKIFKQLNELSDFLSKKYNNYECLHGEKSRNNCYRIINKINSLKDILAMKFYKTTASKIEQISNFESITGQLLNPKNMNFEEHLLFLITNVEALSYRNRNGYDFNKLFCKHVETAKINRENEKLNYYKKLYLYLSSINSFDLDIEYLDSLFDINRVEVRRDILDKKIDSMKYHPKTGKRIVNEFILSIDNNETKKIDDAFSIEKVEDAYIVGIHIADVCSLGYFENNDFTIGPKHNVKKKDASLARNKERDAISLFVLIDSNGIIRGYRKLATTLVNDVNLVYDDIPKILANHDPSNYYLLQSVYNLISVYNLLENDRFPTCPTVSNLGYVIVSKLMVLCGAIYSFELAKNNAPAIYICGDDDCKHYSIEELEFRTGFEGYNNYARVTSPIIDRLSLINQFFIRTCLFGNMTEEQKGKAVLKLRPIVDKFNKSKDKKELY